MHRPLKHNRYKAYSECFDTLSMSGKIPMVMSMYAVCPVRP